MREIKHLSTLSFPNEMGDSGMIIAVCDDGSVWHREYSDTYGWKEWVDIGGILDSDEAAVDRYLKKMQGG